MTIIECFVNENGETTTKVLWRYVITSNTYENNECIINGYYEKVNDISEALTQRLLENGMPENLIEIITGKEQSA